MTSKTTIALFAATFGLAIGLVAGDLATLYGFPYGKYLLELTYEPNATSDFFCARRGSVLGENFSSYDYKLKRQTNCLLAVTGTPKKDGSFDAFPGSTTWYGRAMNFSRPTHIPVTQIKSFKPDTQPF